jgi:hypothetical protein
MVKLSGSIHWRRTKPPGWGGFFIGMVGSPSVAILPRQSFRVNASMIVEIIYVECIAVSETKDHSPVSPDSDAAMVVVFVKAFEVLVADRPDHILA